MCRALKEGASSNRLEIEQIWRQVLEASTHDYDSIGSHSVVAAIEAMIRQDQEAATSRSDRFVGYYMSSAECEYNTPEWLCQLVEQFFDGAVGLDAASNPDSKINARKRFGRQGDGSFVDAFSPANWEIEGAKTCYLNPPGGIIGGNVSVQGTFVNRVVEETKKGEEATVRWSVAEALIFSSDLPKATSNDPSFWFLSTTAAHGSSSS